jgi:hypothetical protein
MLKDTSFIYQTDAGILVLLLLVLMLACIYIGRKVGLKIHLQQEAGTQSTGTSISAMFGLLAFLLAFTFSMSASRYDTRRENIVIEANALGTAILRADLYPEEERKAFREDFKQYLEGRIRYFDEGLASENSEEDYGKKLWDRAARLSPKPEHLVASQQMIPALNEMLDTSTTRWVGELSRVPDSIVWMLFILSLASAFYLGYSTGVKEPMDWFVAFGFCVLTSLVVYITLDLDRPRRGLIQLSTPHKAMLELRKLF